MKTLFITKFLFYAILGGLIFTLAFPGIAFAGLVGAVLFQSLQFIHVGPEVFAEGIIADSVKSLKEKKADLVRQMTAIYNTAKKDNRQLSEEEKSTYNNLKTQLTSLAPEIEMAEELEKLNLETAAKSGTPLADHSIQGDMSDKEKKELEKYSFTRAISIEKGLDNFTGLEKEMHDEGSAELAQIGVAKNGKGIYIPYKILSLNSKLERRDMTAGTAAQGGNAVRTELGPFIDYLWDNLVLRNAGADFMHGLTGNLSFPSESAVPTGTWEGENDANAESSPTVGKLSMTPKRLGTFVDVSNLLLTQTSPSIEARIKRQLFNAILAALDTAGINGSGSDPIPEGILNTTGIGSVAGGTNGLAPAWSHIVKLEEEVAVDNALTGKLAYISNAKVRSKLKQTPKESGQALYILGEDAKELNSHKALFSNLVPGTLTKGSSGAVASAIIFGNFDDLIIGQWGGMEVMTNPYTKAKTAQTELIINIFADVLVKRPQSFAAMVDALTA